ncbi:MAG TPA: hypothetical protein VFG04_29665 [Planctomycetaceae bacterium]|jgi:hypothetical protein|nr:hypothetical protein [Planctomycetaceae bacterium]
MTGFAGSRSLDERRRRRLATDAESVALEQPADASPRRSSASKVKRKTRGPAHFPLRKVISIRYWKLAAVILFATLAAAGILLGGWAAAIYGERLGPGFVFLFRLDAARLVRGFAVIGLLLAGELALLISWARAQSLQDFNGRYRGWVFCALLGFLAAFGLQTQLAAAWSATATWLWATPFSHKATLLWLVPTVACALFVHVYLVREMRDCRLSSTFAWLAALFGCGAAVIVLARPLPLPTPQTRLLECGVAMLFVLCAFSSLLLHARHVVYICADPPSIGPSRLTTLLRSVGSSGIFKFKRSKAGKKSGTPAERDTVSALKRRTAKRTRPLRRKPSSPDVEPSSDETECPVPSARPTRREPAGEPRREIAPEMRVAHSEAPSRRVAAPAIPINSKKPAPPSNHTVVGAENSDDAGAEEEADKADRSSPANSQVTTPFAGMSRRERKLLKKQMRTEQAPLRRSA